MASEPATAQVEQQPGQRLGVFELTESRHDVRDRNAQELDRLVLFRMPLAFLDAVGEEQVHQLSAEAGRRPERGDVPPLAATKTRLLRELALRRRKRLLAVVHRSGGKLQQLLPRRLS